MPTAEDFDNRDEFSVAVFYRDDSYEYIERWVSAERAFHIFTACCKFPSKRVARVIITDGGDCTNAEWQNGKGLTTPPREATP